MISHHILYNDNKCLAQLNINIDRLFLPLAYIKSDEISYQENK